jgi:hypothetical protein
MESRKGIVPVDSSRPTQRQGSAGDLSDLGWLHLSGLGEQRALGQQLQLQSLSLPTNTTPISS